MGNKKSKELRFVSIGLDYVGKTTILYKLKLGEVFGTRKTVGFNVETLTHNNVKISMWDIGGESKIYLLWKQYLVNTQGMIFVIDSSDRNQF